MGVPSARGPCNFHGILVKKKTLLNDLGEIYLVVSTIPIVIIRMFLACASCLFFPRLRGRASLATAARR